MDSLAANSAAHYPKCGSASNVVVVGKKDGTKRFCVDYRKLNDVTRKVSYPLPRPQEMLHELGPGSLGD